MIKTSYSYRRIFDYGVLYEFLNMISKYYYPSMEEQPC